MLCAFDPEEFLVDRPRRLRERVLRHVEAIRLGAGHHQQGLRDEVDVIGGVEPIRSSRLLIVWRKVERG